ncbi:DUF4838 domain-containing protein [Candidatus Poribacteria bacterium]|nr:DUF4838 domain-containing protein [Candidatus Poribacteria bacterium]
MRIRFFLICLMVLLFCFADMIYSSLDTLPIVLDGKTEYRILLGSNFTSVDEFAAQELQGYVMQSSGVFLPLDKGNKPVLKKMILLGKDAAVKMGIKLDENILGADGFIIKSMGERLVLAGTTPRGTLYSVYTFLEILGCRWFAPGIIGEVIPRHYDILLKPIDYTDSPGIKHRGFVTSLIDISKTIQLVDWMGKNKMNFIGINSSGYIENKSSLKGELERRGINIYAIIDDITPDTVGDIKVKIKLLIEGNPEIKYMGIRDNDIKALISESEYDNEIGDIFIELNNSFPDVNFSLISDNLNDLAKNRKNTVKGNSLTFENSSRCYRHSIGDKQCEINSEILVKLNQQLASWKKVYIYEYYMGSYSQNSLPFPILQTIVSDIHYLNGLKALDVIISNCEPGNWGTYSLNYYVFSKQIWNPILDLGSIVDDYCEKYYGSAAEPMKRFFAKLEDSMFQMEHFGYIDPPEKILKLMNEDIFSELRLELGNARSMVDDAMSFDRIRKMEISLDHSWYLWQTISNYFDGINYQKMQKKEKAVVSFQKATETGRKLVKFLFQNAEEDVFIIPESYIFNYLEPIIADAQERKQKLKAQ